MCYSDQESCSGRGEFGIRSDLVLCTLKQPLHGGKKTHQVCEKGTKIFQSRAEPFAAVQGKWETVPPAGEADE